MTKIKLLLTAVFMSCIAVTGLAANDQKVTFVDSYGQLYSHMGEDGLFYVREAGKGQGADPTVKSGWATYVWDTRSRSWKIISKNDLFTMSELAAYLTRTEYYADITPWKNRIVVGESSLAALTVRVDDISTNTVQGLGPRVVALETQMVEQQTLTTALRTDVDATTVRVDTNVLEIAGLKGRTTVVEGQIATLNEYKASNDVAIAELKAKDIELAGQITTAISTANSYTDGKVTELNTRITNEKLDLLTNTAVRVHALENRLTNRINQVEIDTKAFATAEATSKAGTAKDEAIEASKTFTTNKVDAALVEAKGYTDGKVAATELTLRAYTDTEVYNVKTNLTDKFEKADATTLASAKSYSDGNLATAKTYTDTATNKVVDVADGKAAQRDATLNVNLRAFATDQASAYSYTAKTNAIDVAKKYTDEQAAAAQAAAITAAAADASAKTNAVLVSANAYADTKKAEAIAYTTDKLDATDKAELEAGTTKFATKHNLEDVVSGALVFPLRIKKGDITYTLDVVDDGSGDITLKITK